MCSQKWGSFLSSRIPRRARNLEETREKGRECLWAELLGRSKMLLLLLSTILKSIRFIFNGPPTSSFDLERRRNSGAAWWKTIGPSAYFFFFLSTSSPLLTSSSLRSRRLIIIISPRSLWGCNLSSHEPRHHRADPDPKGPLRAENTSAAGAGSHLLLVANIL